MNQLLKDKVNDIISEMQMAYLHDKRPWIIGYSGGKDSTAVVQLTFMMLNQLAPEKRHKKIYVISSDTRIENPIILDYLKENSETIGTFAQEHGLPVETKVITPPANNTFWTNVIGKGLPTPTSIRFRWCTERLKIRPTESFITETAIRNGEVVFILGVRKAESSARKRRIENREIEGYLFTPHNTIPSTYVYNPIVDLSTDQVWEILLDKDGTSPWGTSNNDLFRLYSDADGECPFISSTDKKGSISAPSCGGSRFGCWCCTVVKEDKSLTGFINSGEEFLVPLLEFRSWILSIRDKHEYRVTYRRDGNHYYKKIYLKSMHLIEDNKLDENYMFEDSFGSHYLDLKYSKADYDENKGRVSTDKDKIDLSLLPLDEDFRLLPEKIQQDENGSYISILGYGPFTFKARQEILRRLLLLQREYRDNGFSFELISQEELKEIDKIWDAEEDLTHRTLVDIYYDIFKDRLPWDEYKRPLYDPSALSALDGLIQKYNLNGELVKRLLIETNNQKYYTNQTKLDNHITKILNQKNWHQSVTEDLDHDY